MGLRIIEKSKGIWSQTNHSTLLYYLLVVILGGLIASYLLGAIFCQAVYGISFFSSSQVVFDPSNSELISAMKAMQFFNALGTFVLPPVVFLHLRGLGLIEHLKLGNSLRIKGSALVFVMAVVMIPLANFLGALNEALPLPEFLSFLSQAEEQTLLLTEQFLVMDTYSDLLFMILLMGVVAAVGEELLFRGIIQNLFQSWSGSKHLAIWLTALLFSVIHLQYHAILPRFVLGAFIGYVYVNSGNLRAAILLHFFYNTTLVVLSFLIQHNHVDTALETVGAESILVAVFLALILLFTSLKVLPKVKSLS